MRKRQAGQGGDADTEVRDLRAELLKAEAAHLAKVKGVGVPSEDSSTPSISTKRPLELGAADQVDEEDEDRKRQRILEETREIDADSDGSAGENSSDERYRLIRWRDSDVS